MTDSDDCAFEQKQEQPDERNQSVTTQRRKKLWQIKTGYHCSIIGSCLSRRDLRQISRKKIFGLESGQDSFSLHRSLSAIASGRLAKTRALNKFLDNKYRSSIKRYSQLSSDEEICEEWKKDLRSGGGIAGAYWAIMTMQSCGKDILDQVYGDCHMVSFDIFASYFVNANKTTSLQKQIETIKTSLEKTKISYQKERECFCWELRELQKSKGEFLRQKLVNDQLLKENKELKRKLEQQKSTRTISTQAHQLQSLQKETEKLKLSMLTYEKQASINFKRAETASMKSEYLEDEVGSLNVLNSELQEELTSLEEMFQLGMGTKGVCDTCEEKKQNGCQGIGLSGKAVLYVGGRNNMVAHYRDMVEKHGGIFLHHDGGKENSRTLLPKMLSGADAVLCPIDCVSHDACKCVKKICKRNCKPYVMMRSSGLSSLAKGLETIIQ